MAGLADYLAARPQTRYLFTGGKGGVGKTIVAAALARHFAAGGKRTLIASLNPVHSLSSVFGMDLAGGRATPVAGDHLTAVEVETHDVVARYRQTIGQRVREFLTWADIPIDARPFVDIAVTNPAFEESAMFDKMVDIMLAERERYDVIVFDTAAVANAVRLIGLSKIYGLWLTKMIASRKEALSLRVQLSFRKDKVMQEVTKDPLLADLVAMHGRFLQAKEIFINPETTAFFFVTLPLALPIAVVKRFMSMVRGYDIPVGGVVVNGVMEAEHVGAGDDEYLTNKCREQVEYLTMIRRDLGAHVCGFVPLYPDEVVGAARLDDVARDLFTYRPALWDALG